MLDSKSLEYLHEHLTGYTAIECSSQSRVVAIPDDSRIESLEKFQKFPNRIRQTAQLHSCESFCAYVERFSDPDSTVYLDVDGGRFVAVIDHNTDTHADWCSHQARFAPKLSIEWKAWMAMHNQPELKQLELAHHIEALLDTIIEPEPSVMLQAALSFEANEGLTLASHTNLDNGTTRFTFAKETKVNSVVFPHRIVIRIPMHENEPPVQLTGRIRYRTSGDGALAFTFRFAKHPSKLQRDALLKLASRIVERLKDVKQYEGTLDAPQL